jgi:hypothetical protein
MLRDAVGQLQMWVSQGFGDGCGLACRLLNLLVIHPPTDWARPMIGGTLKLIKKSESESGGLEMPTKRLVLIGFVTFWLLACEVRANVIFGIGTGLLTRGDFQEAALTIPVSLGVPIDRPRC